MNEKEKLNRDIKILQDFNKDLDERSLQALEKYTEWSAAIMERSLVFSQFLYSISAGVLAVFFSVDNFNNLIIKENIFYWAIKLNIFSFIIFIFYFKEKLDNDSALLVRSSKKSNADYEKSYGILNKQLQLSNINIDVFFSDIIGLIKENDDKNAKHNNEAQKNYADYYLELFISLLVSSFWLLFFSTQNWCSFYLFLGLILIFIIANNQYRPFYKLVNLYSRLMSKIFPIKNI